MVGYPSEVEELYLAGDGLLACTKPGAVLIALTTSSPELARDIAEAAQVSGRMAFDCPVTGGESGAIAGTLTAIVGATENDIAPVRDILATFAANICCFDGAGKGQAAKLANQVSLGACMVGMADAMAFAELSGLDLEKTRQMILGGTGKSGAMESLAPKALDGDYKPGFMVEHFIKDLRLALAYADDRELALPGADVAFTLYDMLDAIGGAKLGTQAITVLYKEEADAIAAGLDWSQYRPEEHGAHEDGCGCGEHGEDHECGCGHHHGEDHECCGGHGHDDGHECCCGHHHDHDDDDECDDPECSCHHHHHHADEVFTSWGAETPKQFTQADIDRILTALDSGDYGAILRAKGIVPAADGQWLHFDYVPQEHEVRYGAADYTGRLCVIGSQLKEDGLKTLFGL